MSDPRFALFLRTGMGLVVATAVLGWLWSAGRERAAHRFSRAGGDVPAMAVTTWMCAILTLAAMMLGSLGLLSPLAWAALAAGLGWLLRRPLRASSSGPVLESAAFDSDAADSGPSRLFVVCAASLVLGRLAYGLRNPPTDVDSMLYHMPMVAHWMATGGLGAAHFEPQQIGSFYPGNVEVLALGGAWLAGRETLMTLPGVLSLGLLALALRRLAIEAGARGAIAEALALALACSPGVLQLTLGLRVENVMAAWFAVALVFALRARRTRAPGDYETALCSLGLLAGCKATGPALVMIVFPVLIMGAAPGERVRALLSCRFGLATLLMTGGFWLVRNGIVEGNPLYPASIALGPWALPGLTGHADIALTSQYAMWRAGIPGQLTVPNLLHYFGPIALMLVLGALACVARLGRARRTGERRGAIAPLVAVALATALLTVLQPFSGASAPEYPGGPLTFSTESARFVMSTAVVLLPLAAVAWSQLPALLVVLLCAVLASPGLIRYAGHLAPSFVLVALIAAGWSIRPRMLTGSRAWRATVTIAVCAILAAAVTLVEPSREATADGASDALMARFDAVPTTLARQVLAESGGRPIAVVGVVSIWALYGRALEGRPEYIPVGCPLADARAMWRFTPDRRERANEALWMRNLEESGARFVVLVTGRRLRPIERTWCERDPARFEPFDVTAQRAIFRVLGK